MMKTILFDLDGTLTDPQKGIVGCFQYAIDKMSLPTWKAHDLIRFIGPPLHDCFARILHSNDRNSIERAVAYYRERYRKVGMYENTVYQGIYNLLKQMAHKDLRLYVATSKPEPYALKILDHFKLGHYFIKLYGSQMDGTLSDKVDLIEHLLRRENLSPDSVFMVGDRKYDVRAAIENRLTPIGALWGYGSREELVAAGASMLCEIPAQVLHCIA